MTIQKVFVNPNAGEVKSAEIIEELRRILSDLEQGKNVITSAAIKINSMTYVESMIPMFGICELPNTISILAFTEYQFRNWLYSITKYLMWYDHSHIPDVVLEEFRKRYTMIYMAVDEDEYDCSDRYGDENGLILFTIDEINEQLKKLNIPHQFVPAQDGYRSVMTTKPKEDN